MKEFNSSSYLIHFMISERTNRQVLG